MTTTAPIQQRATISAVRVEDLPDEPVAAGQFEFFTAYSDPDGGEAGLLFGCPCGCGEVRALGFDTHESRRPRWHWDGNRDAPTLTPSINILQHNEAGQQIGEHWHGYLTAGVFTSV